jgi:hypothetical protein
LLLGNFILRMRFQKGYFTLFTFGCCSKTPLLSMRFRNVYQSDGQSL